MEYTTIHRTYCTVISQLLLIQYFINLLSESHQIGPQCLKFSQSRVVHTASKETSNRITSNIIQQWYIVVHIHITHSYDIYPNTKVQAGYITDLISSLHTETLSNLLSDALVDASLLITLRSSFDDKSSVISAFYLLILLCFIWQFIWWICCFLGSCLLFFCLQWGDVCHLFDTCFNK